VFKDSEGARGEMTERKNTVVCTFKMGSPRISAYEIHEWIHSSLQVLEETVVMIQIDGPKRQVYIKLMNEQCVHELIRSTGGQLEHAHVDGTTSKIKIDLAGKGTKAIRIANLPPEVPDEVIKNMLITYGTIMMIRNETWSRNYRYAVANGVKIVTMIVNRNIPSHMQIAGHRVLVSYEGQQQTCYRCGEAGHIYPVSQANRKREDSGNTSNNYICQHNGTHQ
jgi:hypothetical protein